MTTPDVVSTLAALIRVNSINPSYPGGRPEDDIQRWILGFFAAHNIPAERVEVLPQRPNVIATLPGKDRTRRILFEAHVDTAGVENMRRDPFEPEVRDGRMYGRGACDTKGGLAAMMHALAELQRDGLQPPCDIVLAAAMDEEYSCRGALHLCDTVQASAAVVAEPTSLRMVVASKGCLRWRVTITGRAAHSSKPHLGANAITRMARLIVALEEDPALELVHHPLVGHPTLNVGMIHGGVQVNIVPEHCQIEVDRRLVPGEVVQQVIEHYEEVSANLRNRFPEFEIQHTPLLLDWPMETPTGTPIVTTTRRVLDNIGLPATPIGVPFGSDASKFVRAGIPSIVLGPGSIDEAHTPDEFVALDQVCQAVTIYKSIMMGCA